LWKSSGQNHGHPEKEEIIDVEPPLNRAAGRPCFETRALGKAPEPGPAPKPEIEAVPPEVPEPSAAMEPAPAPEKPAKTVPESRPFSTFGAPAETGQPPRPPKEAPAKIVRAAESRPRSFTRRKPRRSAKEDHPGRQDGSSDGQRGGTKGR